jgi:hypothetical protein
MKIQRFDGKDSFANAQRMARYGHTDWLWWVDSSGAHATRKTQETLKAVLLAVGTKGKWTVISASDAVPLKGFWWLGLNMLRQMKAGYR